MNFDINLCNVLSGQLLFFACFIVIEAKDGTISVAAAFAGHQEGNVSIVANLEYSCRVFN